MIVYNMGLNKLYCFKWDLIDSNMYIIKKNNRVLIIDPVYTVEVSNFILSIYPNDITVLLTHEHFDHINGINHLREHFKTNVCCIQACAERICCPKTNLSDKSEVIMMFNPKIGMKNIHLEPFVCKADIVFDDHYSFEWERITIDILSAPGHSPGSVCIFLDNGFVFTGDTLLEYQTITRLPGGNKKVFYEKTMPMLENRMNSDFVIFPGHGKSFKYGSI